MRLPRARGDRPHWAMRAARRVVAAPRTRGSTLTPSTYSVSSSGCPAHAGIDLNLRLKADGKGWLPRARGDRPHGRHLIITHEMAAPRTRGST